MYPSTTHTLDRPYSPQERSPLGSARMTGARPAGAIVLPRRRIARRSLEWWLKTLTWANLAGLAAALLLLCLVSEHWWFSAILTYLPRQLYAAPSLLLLLASLATVRRLAGYNALGLLLVVGPLMGLTMPVPAPSPPAPQRTVLKVASGNVQMGQGSIHRLIGELQRFDPDLIVVQEATKGCEPLLAEYAGWEHAHLREFLVLSRYPLRVLDHCKPQAFDRWSAMAVEVQTPDGPIVVGDVHLMTPRHGATGLSLLSPLTGAGVEEFEWHQRLREDEAAETREFFRQFDDRPLLLTGDFNAPTTSSMFTDHWSGLQSAFETAGWGYGYTSPCNTRRLWLANTPWMRIDHLLADERWSIHSCRIGATDGSDHRLLFTELSLK